MTFRNLMVLLVLLSVGPGLAHDKGAHPETGPASQAEIAARSYFTDTELRTQDGKPVRFFSDVLKGHVVAINVMYTNCTEACPLITHQMALVQEKLGTDLGDEFLFVSLTIDPANDTPEVLKAYAERFGARDGWLFLTGSPENVAEVTQRLGQISPDFRNHLTYLMLGNVDEARWAKVMANEPPEAIAARLRALAAPAVN